MKTLAHPFFGLFPSQSLARFKTNTYAKILLGLGAFLLCASGAAAQTPLLSYNFNEGTGTTAASSGSIPGAAVTLEASPAVPDGFTISPANLFGASGSGVSGAPEDRALNLSGAAGMGSDGIASSSGVVYLANGGNLVGGLASFTVTGWFKTAIIPSNSARLITLTDGKTGFILSFPEKTGSLLLGVNGANAQSVGGYSQTNAWTFFAVSYNGEATTNNVSFYVGTASGVLTLLATENSNIGVMSATTAPLTIGNNANAIAPFAGFLDNIELYGSAANSSGALTKAQISTIFENAHKGLSPASGDQLK